jgi:hypothetical protein
MSSVESAGERIERVASAWPGVTVGPHRFGGREYRVGATGDGETRRGRASEGREFGHTHGDRQADIPFPSALRDPLVEGRYTSEHHLYPDSGWVSFYLGEDGDADAVIDLLRLSYLWHVAALQRRGDPVLAAVDVASELAALDFGPRVEAAFGRVLA